MCKLHNYLLDIPVSTGNYKWYTNFMGLKLQWFVISLKSLAVDDHCIIKSQSEYVNSGELKNKGAPTPYFIDFIVKNQIHLNSNENIEYIILTGFFFNISNLINFLKMNVVRNRTCMMCVLFFICGSIDTGCCIMCTKSGNSYENQEDFIKQSGDKS